MHGTRPAGDEFKTSICRADSDDFPILHSPGLPGLWVTRAFGPSFIELRLPRCRLRDEPAPGDAAMERPVVDELVAQQILVRCPSQCGVAEEAPGACKNVAAVVDPADLARKVCRLKPLICVKD